MIMHSKRLIGLHVQTKSGIPVGRVSGIEIETDTGRMVMLLVKPRGIVPGLLEQDLLIAWSAVIEITNDAVIVQDGTVPLGSAALAADTGDPSMG